LPPLEHVQGERLEQRGLVVRAVTPDLVVVAAEGGIALACPGAAWLPVVSDDHVAAHAGLALFSDSRLKAEASVAG